MGESTVIKTAILGLSVFLLSGCASYDPYPEPTYFGSTESSEYYPEKYDAPVAYRSSYYYPWWSMDYFYLGSHHYHPFSAISFSYPFAGYPWYSPYYGYRPYSGYYSSWYRPYYGYPYYDPRFSWGGGVGYGYGWQDPYWYHRYRDHDHYRYGRNHDLGTGGNVHPGPQPIDRRGGRYADRYNRIGEQQQVPIDRRVSVAPAGTSSDRGMVVINRSDGKPRQNRVQPIVTPGGSGAVAVQAPSPGGPAVVVQPVQRPLQTTARLPSSNRPANMASPPSPRPVSRAPGRVPDTSGQLQGIVREPRGERSSRDDQ